MAQIVRCQHFSYELSVLIAPVCLKKKCNWKLNRLLIKMTL